MMTENNIKKLFEEGERIRLKQPNDEYWAGYCFALKDILEMPNIDM